MAEYIVHSVKYLIWDTTSVSQDNQGHGCHFYWNTSPSKILLIDPFMSMYIELANDSVLQVNEIQKMIWIFARVYISL